MPVRELVIGLTVLGLVGCAGKKEPDAKSEGEGNTAGHVLRGKEKIRLQGDIRQVAQFYIQFDIEKGQPPADWEEFKAYMGNQAQGVLGGIEKGDVAVVYGVKPRSGVVVLYEKRADLRGNHVAAMGDGSVHTLKTDELEKALQAQGKPR